MNNDTKFLQAVAEIDEALKSCNEDEKGTAFAANSFWEPCGGYAQPTRNSHVRRDTRFRG